MRHSINLNKSSSLINLISEASLNPTIKQIAGFLSQNRRFKN